MRINNNIMAMNAHRQLGINTTQQSKAVEKLSSGLRINRAGDDAAGLAISEKMRGQIRGLNKASRNAQDDISLIQTTEGALGEVHDIIQRMREMAVQSANDSNTDDDRAALQSEMDQLSSEITRIANTTEFNTRKLLNGNLDAEVEGTTGDLTFHIGANKGQNMQFAVHAMDAKTLDLTEDLLTGVGEHGIEDVVIARTTGKGVAENSIIDLSTEEYKGRDGKVTFQANNLGSEDDTFTINVGKHADLNGYKFEVVSAGGLSVTMDAETKTVKIGLAHAATGNELSTMQAELRKLDGFQDATITGTGAFKKAVGQATKTLDTQTKKVEGAVYAENAANQAEAVVEMYSADGTKSNGQMKFRFSEGSKWNGWKVNVVRQELTTVAMSVSADAKTKTLKIAYSAGTTFSATKIQNAINEKAPFKETGNNVKVFLTSNSDSAQTNFNTVATDSGVTTIVEGGTDKVFDEYLITGKTYAKQDVDPKADKTARFVTEDGLDALNITIDGESKYAGYKVIISAGGSAQLSVSEDNKTIKLTLAQASGDAAQNSAEALNKLVKDNADLKADGGVKFTGEGKFASSAGAAMSGTTTILAGTYTLRGPAKAINVEESVVVNNDMDQVKFGGDLKGVIFKTKDYSKLSKDAKIQIGLERSRSASFDSGNLVSKAKVAAGINISSQKAADEAILRVDNALKYVSAERSKLGAVQNRLEHTIKNVDTGAENLQASESRIRDVDMAKEMMNYTKQNILNQAAQAMLAQANQAPQSVLQLLR